MPHNPPTWMRSRATLLLLPLFLLLLAPVVMMTAKSRKREAALELLAGTEGLARLATDGHRHRADAARDLLATLARLPEVRRLDGAGVTAAFTEVLAAQDSFLDLRLLGGKAEPLAGALRPGGAPSIEPGPEVETALREGGFHAGTYRADPGTGRAFLPCALSVGGSGAPATAVLFAALDLSWLASLSTDAAFPLGGELVVLDVRGLLLQEKPEGACVAGLPQRVTEKRQGILEYAGSDGTPRLAGLAAFSAPGGNSGWVCTTESVAQRFGPADQAAWRGLVGLACGAGILLVLISVVMLARPRRIEPPGGETAAPTVPMSVDAVPQAELGITTDHVKRVQHQTRTLAMINEMSELLADCKTVDEAYGVVGRFAQVFFPDLTGALLVPGAEPGRIQIATDWGTFPAVRMGGDVYSSADCEAIALGKPYVIEEKRPSAPLCRHLADPAPMPYVCIPMLAQDEFQGVLHIGCPNGSTRGSEALPEFRRQLGARLAEHIALALHGLKTREDLRSQTIRDPLTGLYNRRFLERRLREEIGRADRKRRPLGVIMLDLDHFKRFNDTYGHEGGDVMLKALGEFILGYFRGSDVVCRYGGEEFVAILPEANLADSVARAERLRQQIKSLRVNHRGQELGPVTLSLGVASYPEQGRLSDELLRAADAALYRAKHEGRDRVCAAPAAGAQPAEATRRA